MNHTVEAALLALSSVDGDHASERNGIGFNGRDTGFGNSLAKQLSTGKTLSPRQLGTAYRMLKTYRTQLKDEFGIDYDSIPKPSASLEPQPRLVDFQGGVFLLSFPYDAALKEALKASMKTVWDPDRRAWLAHPTQAVAVGRFAIQAGFKPTQAALDQLGSVVANSNGKAKGAPARATPAKATPQQLGEQDDNWKLSWASDSEIDVPLPEGLELRGFQKADIEYATKNLKPGMGVIFGDEMGLGKSPQSLLVLKLKDAYPALITMPRVVWIKWAKEVQKWTPGKKVALLAGSIVTPKTILLARRFGAEVVRLGQPLPQADIYLVKASVLYKWAKPVGSKVGNSKYRRAYSVTGALKALAIKAIIYDEAHYFKEEGSQRTKSALAIAHSLKPDVRLALSGTIILNRHRELMTILTMLGRLKDVAKDEWDYLNLFCNANGYEKKGQFGRFEFDGSPNGDLLNHRMRSGGIYAQHEKRDRVVEGVSIPGVLDQLPGIIPDYVPAELEDQSRYDKVHLRLKAKKRDYAKGIEALQKVIARGAPEDQVNKHRAIMKALENEVGVLSNEAHKVCGEEKLKFSIEWIEDWMKGTDPQEKLIVFGYHRDVNEAIAQHFGAPLIYGGQNDATRQEAEDSFQGDPACRLVVCQIKAANVGIDLTAATAIVFVELPSGPGDIDQAIGRAYGRLNDVHGVSVSFMVYYGDDDDEEAGETIDEHWLDNILAPKRGVQKKLVSGGLTTSSK